jgi:amino acid adenylation domain-containing protein
MTRESIHDWVTRVAAERGEAIAIDAGTRRMTYAELEARSNRLAGFLLASGAPRGTRLGILTGDVIEVIATVLAALKAGLVFVPFDPRTPERRLRSLIEEVSVGWIAADSALAPVVSAVAPADKPTVLFFDGSSRTDERFETLTGFERWTSTERPAVTREPDDLCYVYFTSGSTGHPKGIAGRLKAIDHFVRWEIAQCGLQPGVRVSQLTTPSFDASLRDFFTPLAAGGTVCVPPPGTVLDAEQLVEWIDAQQINLVHCVPSVFRSMLNEGLTAARFSALRHVVMAGEAILAADAQRWFEIFGSRISLVNLYGPSETTMTKFFHVVTQADADRRLIPIGKPMPGASGLVVDDNGKPCPAGVVGEIYIRTPYRSLGYFGREELTRAVFIPNPFAHDPNDLVYKTGDLGRMLKDGTFELVGRRDHQVKIRGERVELGAIETALRSLPAVKDVAVVDRDDATGTKYLCAYVVLADGTAPAALRDALASEFPSAMVPSVFVALEALPRLINGKIDRAALPVPDQNAARSEVAFEAPRNPVEERLAALFAEVLGVTRVGIRESFFELGGHSLLATQLVSRIRRTFEIGLPVRALFDAPTVAALAEHVDVLRWAAAAPAAAGPLPGGVTEIEL